MPEYDENAVEEAFVKIGFPGGFPGSECVVLGSCPNIQECRSGRVCPYLSDEQKAILADVGYI